jgi:ribosomal protein L7Ae-like RNA K-turn-binding protein
MVSGESAVEKALRSGEAKLVITCEDASANTKKKFCQKAFYYGVTYLNAFLMEELRAVTGLNGRATVAVTDEGFAGKLKEMLQGLPQTDKPAE